MENKMFTGIVSHVWKIKVNQNLVILYVTQEFSQLVKLGDSVCVNGICLTVIKIETDKLIFHITEETINKTNLKYIKESLANVELAVKYGDHLGGHLILGHIHTTGKVLSLEENGNLWIYIDTLKDFSVNYKGSIAINGVSLTVAEVIENKIRIALIPETIKRTIPLKEGDIVNVEFDSFSIPKKDPMRIAIEEGKKGRKTAPPNPWVGCVIFKNGKEISRGYHESPGKPHAEINAIEKAKESLEGSTLYVTLEPCCLFPGKRTPSCAERIVQEKISKVVIGVLDPNPKVKGKGVEILKNAGITVLLQEDLDKEIYEEVKFNLREYIYYKEKNIPYITAKIALTLDNSYFSHSERWITHGKSREELYNLWEESQAIILGARTVEKDLPRLTIKDSQLLSDKYIDKKFNFKKIIIDGTCLKNLDQEIFSDELTYVVTSNPEKWQQKKVKLIQVKDTYNIEKVIQNIHKTLPDVLHCLVEGGGILHKYFFNSGYVNELTIFRSEKVFGKNGYTWDIPPIELTLKEIKTIRQNEETNIFERYIVKNVKKEEINEAVSFDSVEKAVEVFQNGGFVLVMDDENRENEGDLIVAAEKMTEEQMTEMINMTTGIICTPMEKSRAKKLNLNPMITDNTDVHQTAFTVSVDSIKTSTGVSSKDRLLTVKALADETTEPRDLNRPGHIFPLVSRSSLQERRGHTEAAVTLCKLANIYPRVAVIGELKNVDGSMKRRDDCMKYAKTNNIPIITIEELSKKDISPKLLAECLLQTKYGENPWRFLCFDSGKKEAPHKVLIYGDMDEEIIPLRIHSECFTGDVLGSLHCDCGEQLDLSMKYIVDKGKGVLIFPSSHEGRGIGITEKVKAYSLQAEGYDTFQANKILGHHIDGRSFEDINSILNYLKIEKVELITENPFKIKELGQKVVQTYSLQIKSQEHNEKYLQTKKGKLGHLME
jgi:3,4-dihydroxy 2-butanone 4-phosphate synthase/GTP cyclohydrolase II